MTKRTKKILAGAELEERLIAACDGLTYISETDAPIIPFRLHDTDEKKVDVAICDAFGLDRSALEFRSPTDLFQRLTQTHAWHTSRDAGRVKKFAELRDLLAKHLKELTLLRAGKIRIDIFLAGRDAAGSIIGVRTKAVET